MPYPVIVWFVRARKPETMGWGSFVLAEDLDDITEALVRLEVYEGPFALDDHDWN
jgi:hypothetical protein